MTHVNITSRKLFLILFSLVLPIVIKAEQKGLEEQLRKVIANKKAQIGIAVIINSKDTITINNDARYPMMSVFKLCSLNSCIIHTGIERKDKPELPRKEKLSRIIPFLP